MLEGEAAIVQGDMNKLEKLDDRSTMKCKNAKSYTWGIIAPCKYASWGLS